MLTESFLVFHFSFSRNISVDCHFLITLWENLETTWKHFSIISEPSPAVLASIISIFGVLHRCSDWLHGSLRLRQSLRSLSSNNEFERTIALTSWSKFWGICKRYLKARISWSARLLHGTIFLFFHFRLKYNTDPASGVEISSSSAHVTIYSNQTVYQWCPHLCISCSTPTLC